MSDKTVRVGDERIETAAVTGARIVPGRRDSRPLVGALASLLLAVLVPTFAVGAGVDFFAVAPVGAVLFLAAPVGLALWLRSGERVLLVETAESTYREPLDADSEARAERIVESFGD